ncbi:MAG: hypothetical protein M3179_10125, partial [Actinomycetota bacterium]|nr:hypothetical protein [Actinomycetota bacterium]
GQAGDTLATARRLRSLPAVSAAARRGELSPSQASAIAEAAELNPGAETRLVQKAGCASLAELRDDCAATKAAVSDAEAQRRRIHARRYLRSRTDAEGGGHLHFYDTPEIVAEIEKALAPRRDELWRAARAAGKPERVEACAADALAEAVKATPAEAPPAPSRNGFKSGGLDKLIARIDLSAWLRGYPVDEETCELVGYGPVAVSALRDMVASGDPFLAAVATKGVDVVSVAHLGRRPTAHQQTALEWLFPTCAAEGCNERVRLENDHRAPWADTHITLLGLLERLCARDHWLKTHRGWALVAGTGKRPFVPPDDPRHPRSAGGHERPPP